MSARRNQPSTVFTSHQITYTVKARGKTVTRPLIVSVKIFRMGQSSHVQDRGAAAALHVILRPIVVHVRGKILGTRGSTRPYAPLTAYQPTAAAGETAGPGSSR